MLFRIQELEDKQENCYTKDDKYYELQSCNEFIPAKNKTISDYGWIEFETEEKAIECFGLKKVEDETTSE